MLVYVNNINLCSTEINVFLNYRLCQYPKQTTDEIGSKRVHTFPGLGSHPRSHIMASESYKINVCGRVCVCGGGGLRSALEIVLIRPSQTESASEETVTDRKCL